MTAPNAAEPESGTTFAVGARCAYAFPASAGPAAPAPCAPPKDRPVLQPIASPPEGGTLNLGVSQVALVGIVENETTSGEPEPNHDPRWKGDSILVRFLGGFAVAGSFGFIEGLGGGFSDAVVFGVFFGFIFGSIAVLAGKRGVEWALGFLM